LDGDQVSICFIPKFMVRALFASLIAMPALAHHGPSTFDTTHALWVKGKVVSFNRVNPHSIIVLDEPRGDGTVHRWWLEGPSALGLADKGREVVLLPQVGDVIEVCGFAKKASLKRGNDVTVSKEADGQVMIAQLLVMPDGRSQPWLVYGSWSMCQPANRGKGAPTATSP
jgi:hypothetical protein